MDPAPVEDDVQDLFGEPAAARVGFGVHVEDPSALGKRFSGEAGPTGENDAAAGENFAVGFFNQPGFIGGVAEGLLEILCGGFVDGVKDGGIAVPHLFEHGTAVPDKTRKIGEGGFADASVHKRGV